MGSLRGGEGRKMEKKKAREETFELMMNPRKAKVESLRGRQLRKVEGKWRRGEGTGGLGLLSPGAESQTEQTAEGTGG